ncbi:hypothetical protein KSP39_PZI007866 [Platanthera zijinensis]|uniref:Non-specific phospholipase C4 n=1 Tax=Platanthera zijinensis TaxID=2320716 RepID=A0AAP0G934_9ASPA
MASQAGPIRTVVILVQENRSFDHMLGWMKLLNSSINGVTGAESNPTSTSDSSSATVPFSDRAEYVDPDPGHSIQAIYEQIYGVPFTAGETPITVSGVVPPMNGFVQQAERQQKGMSEAVMNGFLPKSVPVYRELVTEFAVCDRWFASVPASTQPNRLFVHSATSHGLTSNDIGKLVPGMPQKTIFDSLDEAGLDFGIYYQYPPSTLFYRNLRQLKYVGRFHQFDLSFKRHCKEGKLPNYVVVEQRYFDLKILPGNDDHPSHDVSEGQKLVKEVYEALRSSPQWNEILFVITYDEHGGFFDHVPTPVAGVPSPDDIAGPAPFNFQFDRLGVRVPTIFISPWIEKGTVTLPEVKKMKTTEAAEDRELSDFQRDLVQLASVLNGDHMKDIFPHGLVQGMTVAQAARYTQEAFKIFLHEAERCQGSGAGGSYVVELPPAAERVEEEKKVKSSRYSKWLACFACNPRP